MRLGGVNIINGGANRVNFTFADANDVKLPLLPANNTLYFFTMITVDTGGRYGHSSNEISYKFNGK